MALKLADRVVELSTSTGTGAFTLSGAQAGYQAFSSRLSNGDTTYYTIQGKNGDGSLNNEWEVGLGTYSSSTLTRDTVLDSSNSGSLVNFSAGNKDVFIDLPSEKAVYRNNVNVTNTLAGVQFDINAAPTIGVGMLGWDGNNTLGLGMSGGNIIQEIGLQTYVYGKASSAITKGQLIRKTGANGSSGVVTFAPTTANMTNSGDIIGIAAENIALNGFGYIISTGNIKGFNTTGSSSGETWADGDTLYYNPTGNGLMTKVKPSAPNVKAEVAIVTNAGSGGSGSVVVEIIHGSQLGGTDSNVQFTSPTTGQSLVYNSSTGIWVNGNNQVINGGTIDNTPIGATTPSTGKFTSVTTPSVTATTNDLTLSAISTGAVKFNTLGGEQVRISDATVTGQYTSFSRGVGQNIQLIGAMGTANLGLYATGGGVIRFLTASNLTQEQFRIADTVSAVNYVQVSGGATGQSSLALRPRIQVQGSDASVGLTIDTKGSGAVDFTTNSNNATSFRVFLQDSPVNYFQVRGSSANIEPVMSVLGSDTNISFGLQSKGTGAIDLAAGSDGVNISNGGTVTAITRTAVGTNYTTNPSVVISAPTTAGGVQATATVPIGVATFTVSNGGTGYTVGNVLTMVGGTFTTAATCTVSAVSGGVITAVTATSTGTYTAAPTNPASVTGGSGTGATFTLSFGILSTFTITNAGSGYIEQPTVTFSGGGGSGASAYASVGSSTTIRHLTAFHSFTGPSGISFAVNSASGTVANYVQAGSQSAGNFPSLAAQGSDTNIGLDLFSKGTSPVRARTGTGGAEQFRISDTASAVNYVQVTGAATTAAPVLSAQGSDTNVTLGYVSKGSGQHIFATNGTISNQQFRIGHTNNAVNYVQVAGAATTGSPILSAQGSDTNIGLFLQGKGTGSIFPQTNGSAFFQNLASATQFRILSTASSVNHLQVTGAITTGAPVLSAQGSDANVGLTISTKGTGTLALNGTNIQTTGSLTQTGNATFLSDIFSIYDSSGSNEAVRSTYNSGNSTFTVDFRAGTRVTAPIFESTTQFTFVTSPTNNNTSVTITAGNIVNGILTGTPAANINYTLPTGTNMDAQFGTGVNGTAEWSIINLAGATFSITVLGNTGHTLVGNMVVAANSSARFGSRKTATNTYVTYRLS